MKHPTHRTLAAWAAATALAACPGLAAAAWWAGTAAGEAGYRAEERLADGSLFNSERGRLGTRGAWLAHTAAWGVAEFAWQRSGGLPAYSGQTQFGLPLYTQTHLVHEQWTLQVAPRFALPLAGMELRLPVGLARQRLGRGIRATPISTALQETLRADELRVGAALLLPLGTPALRLGVALHAHQPWAQSLHVDAGARFTPVTLAPQRRSGWAVGLSLAWRPQPGLELGLGWAAQRWRPGPSDSVAVEQGGIPIGAIRYPGARQGQAGWQGSVAIGF